MEQHKHFLQCHYATDPPFSLSGSILSLFELFFQVSLTKQTPFSSFSTSTLDLGCHIADRFLELIRFGGFFIYLFLFKFSCSSSFGLIQCEKSCRNVLLDAEKLRKLAYFARGCLKGSCWVLVFLGYAAQRFVF